MSLVFKQILLGSYTVISQNRDTEIERGTLDTSVLKIMLVWMITRYVDMSMYMDVVLVAFVDMSVVNLIKTTGGVAEEVPVMGNDDLIEVKAV